MDPELDRPVGHGDFAEAFKAWTTPELFAAAEAVADLRVSRGYQAIERVLAERKDKLVSRLVHGDASWNNLLGREQVVGMIGGIEQAQRATESLLYAADQRRKEIESQPPGEPGKEET